MTFFPPPIKKLVHDYESKRKEEIEAYYDKLDKRMKQQEVKEVARMAQPIVPAKSLDQLVEESKTILPNILHAVWEHKLANGVERDVVNMHEMKKAFDLPHTRAYAVRQEPLMFLQQRRNQSGDPTPNSWPQTAYLVHKRK